MNEVITKLIVEIQDQINEVGKDIEAAENTGSLHTSYQAGYLDGLEQTLWLISKI